MNETLFDKLIETAWRRKLTADEEAQLQAWLARHPEDAKRWEAEAGLNGALESIKPVVPSSNFTSLVLRRIELEARASQRAPTFGERVRRWLSKPALSPRWAVATGLCAIALTFGVVHHRQQAGQLAGGVKSFSTIAAVTSPEALEDFDAIREFSQAVAELDDTDEALFALLTK